MRNFIRNRRAKGFTIIELMVSLSILTLLTLFSTRIYFNYTAATRDLKAANLIYEEGRHLMERVVREVRQNAIDYEQYWNQNVNIVVNPTDTYTDNYCEYGMFFTDDGPDGNPYLIEDNESTGFRNPTAETDIGATVPDVAAVRSVERELYLINIGGDRRSMLKRIPRIENGVTINKLSLVRLIGKDFGEDHINRTDSFNDGGAGNNPDCLNTLGDTRENDGLIDTWRCDPDFPCITNTPVESTFDLLCTGFVHTVTNDNGFIDISPSSINVVDIKFMIAPTDDPWKAYNMDNVQIQPHVTIQMTVEANPRLVSLTNESRIPSITLTSTVSTRVYDEVKSACFQ